MKVLIQKHRENPIILKAFHWAKLISITGGAQVMVQFLGLVSGILVIRMLPTNEYALYTLANTMLGTIVMLTDSGVSTGVMSQGSKVWQDKTKLGTVLATGMHIRKNFAIIVLIISAPIFIFLIKNQGASWFVSILMVVSVVPAFLTTLSSQLLSIAPQLHQDIIPLQKNQIISNFARLLVTTFVIFTFPFAFLAVLASGIPQLWANRGIKRLSSGYADWNEKPDPVVRKEILNIVKLTLPGTIYYCLYSQINIWLCSLLGSTDALAKIGALSRLVIVLSLIASVFNTLVTPRFSRLSEDNKHILLKRFFQIFILLVCVNSFIVLIVWLFPTQILWILGKNYSNLTTEIILNVTATCLTFLAGTIVGLYTSRGWILNPVISISVSIISILSGSLLFKLSSIKGIFIFNIYLAVIQVVMYFIYILFKINNIDNLKRTPL